MKIPHLILLLLLFSINKKSKIDINTYSEKTDNGYVFYADSNEYCPVSIKVNFDLENLKSTKGNDTIFVLPARTKKIELTKLLIIQKGKKYSYKSSNIFNYGNHYLKTFDNNFVYSLPFESNKKFKINQGYYGSFSHQKKMALDFSMPQGTLITAAREGVVIKVLESNNI